MLLDTKESSANSPNHNRTAKFNNANFSSDILCVNTSKAVEHKIVGPLLDDGALYSALGKDELDDIASVVVFS